MTSVITHDWTVNGPGGDYGVMEYVVGENIRCYFVAGPVHFTVPLDFFTIVTLAIVLVLITVISAYARHRRASPNAA